MRKPAGDPLEVGEHSVATLTMQASDGVLEEFAVIHHHSPDRN
jgi:hypothetical protein